MLLICFLLHVLPWLVVRFLILSSLACLLFAFCFCLYLEKGLRGGWGVGGGGGGWGGIIYIVALISFPAPPPPPLSFEQLHSYFKKPAHISRDCCIVGDVNVVHFSLSQLLTRQLMHILLSSSVRCMERLDNNVEVFFHVARILKQSLHMSAL